MTEEAQRRTPWREPGRTRARAANSFSNVGFDSHLDFSLDGSVHYARVSRLDAARHLRRLVFG